MQRWLEGRPQRGLVRCAGGNGNMLLNIGPKPDGSVPPEAIERLKAVGKWTSKYGEVLYGPVDRPDGFDVWSGCGTWTRKGKDHYFWVYNWPGETLAIGGLRTKVKSVELLPTGRPLRFKQEPRRLLIHGLPKACPDKVVQVPILKINFAGKGRQVLSAGVYDGF